MYIAFQAYREIGSYPTPIDSEVRENELDEMYRHMQTISPLFIETARRAAKNLGGWERTIVCSTQSDSLEEVALASLELHSCPRCAMAEILVSGLCD
jgi:hypothetical protein